VEELCELNAQAPELHKQGIHLISIDEKTGIQALERANPTMPMKAGNSEKQEFNYIRHGTQVLIGNLEIATGKSIVPRVGDTRTEEDFVNHIEQTVATDEDGEWIFILDQLNTHKSESLVQYVAKQTNHKQELGKKGKCGILKNMATRKEYLENKEHRIRFVYTPKHTSWLNLIECFFSGLSKRVLKRGNFKSQADLKQKIVAYIEYYNLHLAKIFNWTVAKKEDIKKLVKSVKRYVAKFMG
jgi:transposase